MRMVTPGLVAALLLPAVVAAQRPAADHVAAARAAAGEEHTALLSTICPAPGDGATDAQAGPSEFPGVPGRPEWYAAPAKVFDNLYFVGQTAYTAWAVTTSEGIIVIDPLFDYSVEAEIVEGLRSLGLDPADIRYVVVSHGHSDHAGGARLLQERFGARVILHEEDWALLERNTGSWPKPRRDIVAGNEYELRLGDTTLRLFHTPGHTPGTLSSLIPVRDGGRTHLAALWGGTGFNFTITPERPREHWLREYATSARRFREAARRAGADVLLANHARFDRSPVKLPALARRRPGEPHPYVVGTGSVERYLTVAEECARAALSS